MEDGLLQHQKIAECRHTNRSTTETMVTTILKGVLSRLLLIYGDVSHPKQLQGSATALEGRTRFYDDGTRLYRLRLLDYIRNRENIARLLR